MRIKARKDDNQDQMIKELRDMGFSVAITHQLGGGFGDIVVGYKGLNFIFEIKDPDKIPSKQGLTEDEERFHKKWQGQVSKVLTAEEARVIILNTFKKFGINCK